MQKLASFFDKMNEVVGRIICFLIFPIIIAIVIEVVMRYFLKASQLWVPETSMFLFGAMFALGGGYTYLHDGHVRMDVVYNLFSVKARNVLDIICFIPFLIYCLVICVEGSKMAFDAIITAERSASAFAPYLFPIKACIPVGGFLLILQGFSKLIGNILSFKSEVPK